VWPDGKRSSLGKKVLRENFPDTQRSYELVPQIVLGIQRVVMDKHGGQGIRERFWTLTEPVVGSPFGQMLKSRWVRRIGR